MIVRHFHAITMTLLCRYHAIAMTLLCYYYASEFFVFLSYKTILLHSNHDKLQINHTLLPYCHLLNHNHFHTVTYCHSSSPVTVAGPSSAYALPLTIDWYITFNKALGGPLAAMTVDTSSLSGTAPFVIVEQVR
jgi:hypothetical protein